MTDLDILVELMQRTIVLRSPEDVERVDFSATAGRLLARGVVVPNDSPGGLYHFLDNQMSILDRHLQEIGPFHTALSRQHMAQQLIERGWRIRK